MIVGGCWFAFSFEAFNMALLLLSVEQLFSKGKSWLFPIAIFLICISQPFNLYVYGLFLITYTVIRHVQSNNFTLRSLGLTFIKMAGLGAIGVLLSGPFLLENIVQLLESPRGSGTTSYTHILSSSPMFATADALQLLTGITRFFSNDLVGDGESFYGWKNYLEAPLFYCGLPCLILVPQVFLFLEKRVRVLFISILILWLLPFIFPYLRYAFWLFAGDYYRAYSFFIAFFLLFYALVALDKIITLKRINLTVLAVTVGVLLLLLSYPYFINIDTLKSPDSSPLDPSQFTFIIVMLLIYGILIFLMTKPAVATYSMYAFLLAVAVETIYLSGTTINNMEASSTSELLPNTGYQDHTLDALEYLKKTDNSFYRIDKTYYSSPAKWYSHNDGMVQGYRGTRAYTPFNQQHYILYLQLMGIVKKDVENESRWAAGLAARPVLGSQNRVKYFFAKTNVNPLWSLTCDRLPTFGDVQVFKNKFVLPFGYTYNKFISEREFSELSDFQKDFVSLRACVLKDEDFSKAPGLTMFNLRDTLPVSAYNPDNYRQFVNDVSRDTLQIDQFDDRLLTGKISVPENKMMYLSIPYDDGWQLKVDGNAQRKIILSAGMTGIMLPKGQHQVEMSYHLRYFGVGLILSLAGAVAFVLRFLYQRKPNISK